jgi:hypothetical protein
MLAAACAVLALIATTAGAATDYAEYVPADVLVYFGYPYSADTAAKVDALPSAKMLHDEQLMKAMDDLFASLPMEIDKEGPIAKAGLGWRDIFAIVHGGFAFAFDVKMEAMDVQGMPEGTKPPMVPKMDAAVYIDRANPEMKAVLNKAVKALDMACEEGDNQAFEKKEVNIGAVKATFYADLNPGMSGITGIYVFEQGDMTILATSEALCAKIIDYVAGKGNDSLAKSELYTKAMAKLGDNRINACFLNYKEMFARFGDQMQKDPDAARAMNAMHFDSLQAIVAADSIDENGVTSQLYLYCPDGKLALLKPFQGGKVDMDMLGGVSKKAFACATFSGLWNWIDGIAKSMGPDDYKQFTQDMQESEKELGLKIKEDILASFGGEMTVVMTSPSLQGDAQGIPVPVALVAQINDKAKVDALITKIYENEKVKPKVQEYGDAKHQISVLPQAAVCTTDKYCIVANSTRTMEDVLDVMDGQGGATIAEADHFKKAAKMLGSDISFLMYLNMKDLANVLDNWEALKQAFEGAGKPENVAPEETDGEEVPPTEGGNEEVPAPDTPFALAALAAFIIDAATDGAQPSDEGMTNEDNSGADEAAPQGEEGVTPEELPMPQHFGGMSNVKILKKIAAILKISADYRPALYIGISADNEGMSIKMVMPE